MVINSDRRNLKQLDNCQKFAHRLSWNVRTWHELEGLTFCGQSTSLLFQSSKWWQTNKFRQCWETRPSIADWVHFKTRTLLTSLRTRNQSQEVSCVFWIVELLSQQPGCPGNKRQFHTVPHSLKLFLWKSDRVWMEYLLLICGTWLVEVLRSTNNNIQPNHEDNWETGAFSQFLKQDPKCQKKAKIEPCVWCGFCVLWNTFFSGWVSVVYFWRLRSSDQKDNQGTKSDDETRVKNP